jgi:hypothetical protein
MPTTRPDMPALPAGNYAVDDPDQPGRLTFWQVPVGAPTRLVPYPPGTRWAPLPPSFADEPYEQRRPLRDVWYQSKYWPWKREVARTILAAPGGAVRAFTDRYPGVPPLVDQAAVRRAQRAQERVREQHTQARDAVAAAALAAAGLTVSALTRHLGLGEDRRTARRRLALGREMIARDPEGARSLLAEWGESMAAAARRPDGSPAAARVQAVLDQVFGQMLAAVDALLAEQGG